VSAPSSAKPAALLALAAGGSGIACVVILPP
jgi:hypothetical protein